jgi:hypothetical protein
MDERRTRAMAALDALHGEDPAKAELDGVEIAEELLYARRMSGALARLVPAPSEALELAVRAQHLCRWRLPRSSYPEGRAGYHAWRRESARQHSALAASTLSEAGYDAPTIARVTDLIEKKDCARDAEAQALEDAACLVFLEHHLEAFAEVQLAEGKDEGQLADIVQKTWRKMSDRARELALELPLSDAARGIVERALAG